jgi:hypothetical protein
VGTVALANDAKTCHGLLDELAAGGQAMKPVAPNALVLTSPGAPPAGSL